MKHVKDKVLEIAEIAKACPENLQSVCFETLLKHYLGTLHQPAPKAGAGIAGKPETGAEESKPSEADAAQGTPQQEDIKDADIHLKVKRFMEKEGVTLAHLNNLYYKEGDQILPLFDDLKTTRMAESQIRIALLQSLVSALTTGDFQVDVAAVRAEATQRKCLDGPNFMANFRNNKTLFDSENIDRHTKTLRLSDAGRKELADIVKELQ